MSAMSAVFNYGEDILTCGIALKIARGSIRGILTETTKSKISHSEKIVQGIIKGNEAVYGINTGFGSLCDQRISIENTAKLQHNILKSHSVGMGDPIPTEIAKLMLILKVQALAQAYSGIRLVTLERIIWHIDHNIIPVVPSQGSVGASGDLAPLAHLFLPLIGEGWVEKANERVKTGDMLEQENIVPISLAAKEGLALINGTQFIAAYAVKVVEQLHSCLAQADIIGAMMLEGLLGSPSPFMKEIHQLRPYKGTKHVASRISAMLEDSEIVASHLNCDRVQDPYSLRCMPQVHGASRNAWLHLKELVEIELNAVTDNPVIINETLSISGGNFHGQPLAMVLDYACLAASELGNISDRRIYLSVTGLAENVPKLLMLDTGINSAFMMPQYTSAALASENKTLCFPASADSIPTSLGQEDHVSMGSISGRKALQVIGNVEKILAIEMMYAAQAFDYHLPLKSGELINKVHAMVREHIDHAEEDKVFADDMEKALKLLRSAEILKLATNSGLINSEYDKEFEIY
jgi:histidine ammonia-lyase